MKGKGSLIGSVPVGLGSVGEVTFSVFSCILVGPSSHIVIVILLLNNSVTKQYVFAWFLMSDDDL